MFGVDLNSVLVDIINLDFSQADKALAFGGAMVLIGMLTVFAVLCIIWLCLSLFKIFFHDLPEKRKGSSDAPRSSAAVSSAPVTSSSDEIVAVIAAAIAMAESESNGLKFRVVSFKRK